MTSRLMETYNDCMVSMASRGQLPNGQRLPPYLWEDLRLKLQRIYRQATGEEFAVLSIDAGGDI